MAPRFFRIRGLFITLDFQHSTFSSQDFSLENFNLEIVTPCIWNFRYNSRDLFSMGEDVSIRTLFSRIFLQTFHFFFKLKTHIFHFFANSTLAFFIDFKFELFPLIYCISREELILISAISEISPNLHIKPRNHLLKYYIPDDFINIFRKQWVYQIIF